MAWIREKRVLSAFAFVENAQGDVMGWMEVQVSTVFVVWRRRTHIFI